MKALLLISLLPSSGALAACLSGSLERPLSLTFDLRAAEDAVQEFESSIRRDLPPNASLVINLEALSPRVNAEIVKVEQSFVIKVMGGMLGHPRLTPEALKLLLCHEVGHLLGGAPLKSRNGWSSTEGQADFFSSASCARNLGYDEGAFLDAALALTRIYAEVTRQAPPRLDSCDDRQVERTNYGYPAVQCRLDTLVAGWRGRVRPGCWFKE
jgi:hypothetical protein